MRISEVSRLTGASERMLRYYEEQALLCPQRSTTGYRSYSDQDLRTAHAICQLNRAGLRLETIRMVLPCMIDDTPRFHPCAAVRSALRDELERLEERLEALMQSRRVLAAFVGQVES